MREITAPLIRNILCALRSVDFGDVSDEILPFEVWQKFSAAPHKFGWLSDDQQDAIAAVINDVIGPPVPAVSRESEVAS